MRDCNPPRRRELLSRFDRDIENRSSRYWLSGSENGSTYRENLLAEIQVKDPLDPGRVLAPARFIMTEESPIGPRTEASNVELVREENLG